MPDTETDHGSLELAHEVNKELLDLLTYRSQRRFILSVGLLAVKVGVIGLLGAMAFRETPMQNHIATQLHKMAVPGCLVQEPQMAPPT